MTRCIRLFTVKIALAFTAVAGSACLAPAKADAATAPTRVSGTNLIDAKPSEVAIDAKSKGLVIIFVSARCPCSASHEAILKSLPAKYPDFTFVGLHANADEPIKEATEHFKASGLPFPVLEDASDRYANDLKAFKTPHAFVISPSGEVLYQGGVTDSHVAANAHKQFLLDALEDAHAGRAPHVREGRTLGCAISRAGGQG